MPMCDPPDMTTTSPGLAAAVEIRVPILACASEECGSEMPNCAYTYATSPEQSKPAGLSPPKTYGTPWYFAAPAATLARLKCGYGGFASNEPIDAPEDAGR